MALTKVTGQVINNTTGLVVGVTTVGGGLSATDGFFSGIVTAVGNASFSGNVSVGGTLTYEDVTNIDSVGLVTARNGIVVGSGITLSKDGDGFFTGVVTATSFKGDGSNLTGLSGVSVANQGDNRLITATGTTDALNAESSAVFTAAGKLGLNIASPVTIIHANGNSTVGTSVTMTLQSHDTANSTAGIDLLARDNSNNNETCRVRAASGGAETVSLQFSTADTHRMSIDASGHLVPATNDTYDLGSSSLRWRDIYTGDLNLSNEGKSNDVDGSWGDYTIQEGESDLFLINNRTGKKFKFNLTEVS